VEAVRPSTGWVFVEFGDRHPGVPGLLARARELPLTEADSTGVVWQGPTQDAAVWAWAVEALPWASYWVLSSGLDDGGPWVAHSTDSLSGMWVLADVEQADLRAWLVYR
jgi:hypothetical protein